MTKRPFLPLPLCAAMFIAVLGWHGCENAQAEPPGAPATNQGPGDKMEQDKVMLNRLITELKRSARSFVFLRSRGFNLTDQEFERIIDENNAILRRTRIVRRDEQGVRQIPGWPGVALTTEYKNYPPKTDR